MDIRIRGFYIGAGFTRRYWQAQVGRIYCYVFYPSFKVLRTWNPRSFFKGGIQEPDLEKLFRNILTPARRAVCHDDEIHPTCYLWQAIPESYLQKMPDDNPGTICLPCVKKVEALPETTEKGEIIIEEDYSDGPGTRICCLCGCKFNLFLFSMNALHYGNVPWAEEVQILDKTWNLSNPDRRV